MKPIYQRKTEIALGKTEIDDRENRDWSNMKYDDLEAAFPGKRFTRFLNCTRQNSMTFNSALVYSCLVERATHGKGASQKQVSKATGLNESTSVPAALKALQKVGLAAKKGARWVALEPQGETTGWFSNRKGSEGQAWFRRFSYWWIGRRSKVSSLTTKQNAVYFKLLDMAEGRWKLSRQALVRLLRIDLKTVRAAVGKLIEAGLVDENLWPVYPKPEQMKWFRNKPKKRPYKISASFSFGADSAENESLKNVLDSFAQPMLNAGYSEKQIDSYFAFVLDQAKKNRQVFSSFLLKFAALFKMVEDDHQANKAAGKYAKARNSMGLLKQETRRTIHRLRMKLGRP